MANLIRCEERNVYGKIRKNYYYECEICQNEVLEYRRCDNLRIMCNSCHKVKNKEMAEARKQKMLADEYLKGRNDRESEIFDYLDSMISDETNSQIYDRLMTLRDNIKTKTWAEEMCNIMCTGVEE